MKRHLNHSPLFLYRSGLCILFLVFGTLKAWAQPCDNPVASVNPCLATPICNGTLINNYCAGTDPVAPIVAPTPFCGAPNNNQFIAFIAGSTTISIQFNVDLASCTGTPDVADYKRRYIQPPTVPPVAPIRRFPTVTARIQVREYC